MKKFLSGVIQPWQYEEQYNQMQPAIINPELVKLGKIEGLINMQGRFSQGISNKNFIQRQTKSVQCKKRSKYISGQTGIIKREIQSSTKNNKDLIEWKASNSTNIKKPLPIPPAKQFIANFQKFGDLSFAINEQYQPIQRINRGSLIKTTLFQLYEDYPTLSLIKNNKNENIRQKINSYIIQQNINKQSLRPATTLSFYKQENKRNLTGYIKSKKRKNTSQKNLSVLATPTQDKTINEKTIEASNKNYLIPKNLRDNTWINKNYLMNKQLKFKKEKNNSKTIQHTKNNNVKISKKIGNKQHAKDISIKNSRQSSFRHTYESLKIK